MTDEPEVEPGRTTSELSAPADDTQRLEAPVRSHAWREAAAGAGVAWLGVLLIGAVCALAPKLQFPPFARGADPVEIFTAIVVISLGLFGVPVHIGGLTISALPMGALLAIGVAIAWAVSGARGDKPTQGAPAFRHALRVAAIFSVTALLLSLIFRLRGREVVAADAFWSLFATFLWTIPFAWAGAVRPPRAWPDYARDRIGALLNGRVDATGLNGGIVMLAAATVLAAAALLLWMIVALARGGPGPDFGAGDAGAALLYVVAFLPNLLTAVIAFSMGAPIVRGAQVGVGGRIIGGLEEVSLFGLPDPSALAFLLLLIPIVACSAGGWFLARRAGGRADIWRPVLVAALVFAGSLAVLAWLGEARVGAGLVRDRGVARLAVLALPTFAWGMLWAGVFGWLGWELALRRKGG